MCIYKYILGTLIKWSLLHQQGILVIAILNEVGVQNFITLRNYILLTIWCFINIVDCYYLMNFILINNNIYGQNIVNFNHFTKYWSFKFRSTPFFDSVIVFSVFLENIICYVGLFSLTQALGFPLTAFF